MRALPMVLGAGLALAFSLVGCGLVLGINAEFGLHCDVNTPCDDQNPCTADACGEDGVCVFTSKDGEACVGEAGAGVCWANTCIPPCSAEPAGCDDENPCTEDVCDIKSNKCQHDGSKLSGVACGVGGILTCDGKGNCIQCADASECGANDDCNTYTCESSICKHATAPEGTQVAVQIDGDCLVRQCDAKGAVATAPDDGDLPDDGNDCTADLCAAGAPGHSNEAVGALCSSPSGGTACDGSGACKKALGDKCLAAIDCASGSCVDTYCCESECTELCKSCSKAGALGMCTFLGKNVKDTYPANQCAGLMACDGAGLCMLARGAPCSMGTECVDGFCADGRCCNAGCGSTCKACNVPGLEGTCSNVPLLTQDNFPASACTGTKTCDGAGACKKANGQACVLGSECASGVCGGGPPTVCQ